MSNTLQTEAVTVGLTCCRVALLPSRTANPQAPCCKGWKAGTILMKTMSLAGPCTSPAMVLVSLGVPQGFFFYYKECKSIYTLLWNLGTQHFLAKDYPACVGAYTAALPYADADAKPRVGRQLALAHLALHELDRSADTTSVDPMHDSQVQRQSQCMPAPMTSC